MRNDKQLRDRLKATREDLAGLRADRTRLRKERDEARDAFGHADFSADGDVKITESQPFLDAEIAVANLGECDDKIADAEALERTMLQLLGDNTPAGGGLPGNGNNTGGVAHSWNAFTMLESDASEYRGAIENGLFTSTGKFGTVELGQVVDREGFAQFLAAAVPTAPAGQVPTEQGAVIPDVRGIYPVALKRLGLLDLIPTGTTDSNIIQYVQVTGIPGYAAETAELTVKPQEGITFQDATAPVRTIAGYIKTARQALDDVSGLASLINLLLPYDVRRRLESQILIGNGVGQNLLGILNVSGIGAPASVTGDTIADGILRAMTTIVLSDGDPSFVTLNPLTWLKVATQKASGTGDYMFMQPGGSQALYQQATIWGLAVTQNRLIPQTSPLVGDNMGATLLVREGVNVRVSDADQDDFVNNRVTTLAECRVAFPVWRPSAFAVAPLG